jgi:polyribonucleotide nucleotidyltransferase
MHNFDIKKKTIEIAGRTLTMETGRMAKQAKFYRKNVCFRQDSRWLFQT